MLKFKKEHKCIVNNTDYVIEQYEKDSKTGWYFNIDSKLYAIKYCPYCGKELLEPRENPAKRVYTTPLPTKESYS